MDISVIGQAVFGALIGGSVTGVVSWVKFSNALAITRNDVDHLVERCTECRKLFRDEIITQRQIEHERIATNKKEHIDEKTLDSMQDKTTAEQLEKRLQEISSRLASIEEYLRITKLSRSKL